MSTVTGSGRNAPEYNPPAGGTGTQPNTTPATTPAIPAHDSFRMGLDLGIGGSWCRIDPSNDLDRLHFDVGLPLEFMRTLDGSALLLRPSLTGNFGPDTEFSDAVKPLDEATDPFDNSLSGENINNADVSSSNNNTLGFGVNVGGRIGFFDEKLMLDLATLFAVDFYLGDAYSAYQDLDGLSKLEKTVVVGARAAVTYYFNKNWGVHGYFEGGGAGTWFDVPGIKESRSQWGGYVNGGIGVTFRFSGPDEKPVSATPELDEPSTNPQLAPAVVPASVTQEVATMTTWLTDANNRTAIAALGFQGDPATISAKARYVPIHNTTTAPATTTSWEWRAVFVRTLHNAGTNADEEAIIMDRVGDLSKPAADPARYTADAAQPLSLAKLQAMIVTNSAQNVITVISQIEEEFKTKPLQFETNKPNPTNITNIERQMYTISRIADEAQKNKAIIDLLKAQGMEEASINRLIGYAKKLNEPALTQYKFDLIGHTDSRGAPANNNALSSRRATAVRLVLELAGVNADRFKSVTGKGESELRARETGNAQAVKDAQFKNRRVEIKFEAPAVTAAPASSTTVTNPNQVEWYKATAYRVLVLTPAAIANYEEFQAVQKIMSVTDRHIIFGAPIPAADTTPANPFGDPKATEVTEAYTAKSHENVPAQVYGYESWTPVAVTPPPAPTPSTETSEAPTPPAGATAPQNYQQWHIAFTAAKAELDAAIAAEDNGHAIANYISANPVNDVTKDNVDSKIQGLEAVLTAFATADSKLTELYRAASTADSKQFTGAPTGTTEQQALDAYKSQIEAASRDTKYDALSKLIAPYFKAIMEKKITFALALTLDKTAVKLPQGKGTVSLSYTRADTATNVLLQIRKQGTTFSSNVAAHDETAKTFSFEADAPGKFEILRTTFVPGIGLISVVVAVVEVKKTSGVT